MNIPPAVLSSILCLLDFQDAFTTMKLPSICKLFAKAMNDPAVYKYCNYKLEAYYTAKSTEPVKLIKPMLFKPTFWLSVSHNGFCDAVILSQMLKIKSTQFSRIERLELRLVIPLTLNH